MKLSILTATYNRAKELPKLYESIVNNLIDELDIEWLIMDDGSSDNTKEIVEQMPEIRNLKILYYKQENQGKMCAINNLMKHVTGELVMDCDSDDYFIKDAFKNIYKKQDILFQDNSLYALIFLRNEGQNKLSGNRFEKENEKTTMFDMYFKNNITGEKILVFKTDIRKEFTHELVEGEKFVTEARMYHKMDDKYYVKCFNIVLLEGEYLSEGYTNNIISIFKKYPKGYYEYFKEILEKNMKKVTFNKRIYAIKHFILFKELCGYKNIKIKNKSNQLLYYVLILPGKIVTKYKLKHL